MSIGSFLLVLLVLACLAVLVPWVMKRNVLAVRSPAVGHRAVLRVDPGARSTGVAPEPSRPAA